ncbi:hypothetical protein BRADI_4g32744v3 [Brachypodium distachyon]|uniref:Uncharacterized protein n=1 Tax=Brachypodium distachyon TaxID=15368 RepID=A0A2K2CRV3_BRADI|nr:hypothetical protein BRADI_4g32744v3 [Brachypodium distachyon]
MEMEVQLDYRSEGKVAIFRSTEVGGTSVSSVVVRRPFSPPAPSRKKEPRPIFCPCPQSLKSIPTGHFWRCRPPSPGTAALPRRRASKASAGEEEAPSPATPEKPYPATAAHHRRDPKPPSRRLLHAQNPSPMPRLPPLIQFLSDPAPQYPNHPDPAPIPYSDVSPSLLLRCLPISSAASGAVHGGGLVPREVERLQALLRRHDPQPGTGGDGAGSDAARFPRRRRHHNRPGPGSEMASFTVTVNLSKMSVFAGFSTVRLWVSSILRKDTKCKFPFIPHLADDEFPPGLRSIGRFKGLTKFVASPGI